LFVVPSGGVSADIIGWYSHLRKCEYHQPFQLYLHWLPDW